MRLLIDLQVTGEQAGGEGPAKRLLAFVRGMAASRAADEIRLLINATDPKAGADAARALADVMGPETIRLWRPPTSAARFSAAGPLDVLASRLRAEVIRDEQAGAVLVLGLPAERDPTVVLDWPADTTAPPTVVVVERATDLDRPSEAARRLLASCVEVLVLEDEAEIPPHGAIDGAQDAVAGAEPDQEADACSSLAQKAWSILRELPAEPSAEPSAARVDATPVRRLSLAMVGPLPPQKTGIADYTAELLPALAGLYDLTVVSEVEPDPERFPKDVAWMSAGEFRHAAWRFDRVVHQIGNSRFHQFQIEALLPVCPGVVVLHDVFLPDYRATYAENLGAGDRLLRDLRASEGYAALAAANRKGVWNVVFDFPCSGPVISASAGLIVHSRHALDLLGAHYGERAIQAAHVVPLLKDPPALPDRNQARRELGVDEDCLLVCSFGIATRLKLPMTVLDGWRRALGDGPGASRLVFVGEAIDGVDQDLNRDATAHGCGGRVMVTGRVRRETYLQWLAAADIAVQLRTKSRGESSAAAADCLGAGLPLIVNRTGSLAELPQSAVRFISEEAAAEDLADVLAELASSTEKRRDLAAAAREYVASELAPARIAGLYRQAIEDAYGHGPLAGPLAVIRTAAALQPRLSAHDREPLAQAIADTWPMLRQPCLMIEAPDDDMPPECADIVETLLVKVVEGFRTEPMRREGERLEPASDWIALEAGVEREEAQEPLRPQAGDAVLVVEPARDEDGFAETLDRLAVSGAAVWLLARPDSAPKALAGLCIGSLGILCVSQAQAEAVRRASRRAGARARVAAFEVEGWPAMPGGGLASGARQIGRRARASALLPVETEV